MIIGIRNTGGGSSSPFFVEPIFSSIETNIEAEIFSALLRKSHVGTYEREVSVVDLAGAVDTQTTTINVIGINNAPVISNISAVYTLGCRKF